MAAKKNNKKPKVPLKQDGTPDLRYKKGKDRKPSLYNTLLKQTTKVNNKLPEKDKISIKDRRKIVRNELVPKYKDTPRYKLRIRAINADIEEQFEKVPPKELSDVNFIDISEFAQVDWFSLDETIRELVPEGVYVKVSAGEYGETRIFNTNTYDYFDSGVRDIIENLRPDANNQSGTFTFAGYRKLRPRRRNNGVPENYYLDFVLLSVDPRGNIEPYGDAENVDYEPPRTRDNRTKKTKIRNIIEKKIKTLKADKDSKRRAKKLVKQRLAEQAKIAKKAKKYPSERNKSADANTFTKMQILLNKYLKDGKITQAQFDAAMKKLQ